jgi:hypothetical protein
MLDWMDKRNKTFSRNTDLEALLNELENVFKVAEDGLIHNDIESELPNLFIVGAPRSGTTVMMQCLAHSKAFSYPSNLLSRFYSSLGLGYKIQKMLFDPKFQFQNDLGLCDYQVKKGLSSNLGKTVGALEPNVFWYFWYLHFKYGDLSFLSEEQWQASETTRFINEINIIQKESGKPFAMKAMIMNWNIIELAKLCPNAIFFRMKRDPVDLALSIYHARKHYTGSFDEWWSFKPPEYEQLRKLSAKEQVAGFIISIEKALDFAFSTMRRPNILTVDYKSFCMNPNDELERLKTLYSEKGINLKLTKSPKLTFSTTVDKKQRIEWLSIFEEVNSKVTFYKF